MGAYTVIASYHNGQFYDIHVMYDASEPMETVEKILEQLPNDPSGRKAWVQSQRQQLESSKPYLQWSKRKVSIKENNCLIPGAGLFEASYVLDFDNEVFTVHGTIHFSLHHLPLDAWQAYVGHSRSAPNYLVRSCLKSDTPLECIGTVSRWSKLLLDTSRPDDGYEYLRAIETQASDWGVPGWDELPVSQTLCTKLVQAILIDHADIFTNPDVAGQRSMHNLCCWQVVSASAPSLLVCLPMKGDKLSDSDELVFQLGDEWPEEAKPHRFQGNIEMQKDFEGYETEWHYDRMKEMKQDNWDHVNWALRGCLITFCPRLDAPEFVKSEVVAMVAALKRSPSGKTVGIVYSGKHVVAVSIDGDMVRHTPALLVHDITLNIQDGALLLVHLLTAQLGNKTFESLSQTHDTTHRASSGVFPGEILTEIIHYSDYQTYLRFFHVSHYTRAVCLSYPRINESILLRAVDGGFMVRNRIAGIHHTGHMRRVDWRVHKQLDSSFHIRQAGAYTSDGAKSEFVVPMPDQRLYRCFTESRRRENMTEIVALRVIVVWGRWVMRDGLTDNENQAATPKRPAYWSPIFGDHDV
ncbi:hypothetical protein FRC08_002446 [Ceratobasidium sp. 394]|nr:hypothetical protein FRC08_002446 [Ceratobasidium sp. 394]